MNHVVAGRDVDDDSKGNTTSNARLYAQRSIMMIENYEGQSLWTNGYRALVGATAHDLLQTQAWKLESVTDDLEFACEVSM